MLPIRSSHLPRTAGQAYCPPTVLLRIEFTATDCSQPSGELLPRLSTLTASSQSCISLTSAQARKLVHFAAPPFPVRTTLLGSVRSTKKDAAVYLCCTFPEVAFGGRYPLSLPYGARTFLTHRLSPYARGRSAYSLINSTTHFASCQRNSYYSHKLLRNKHSSLHKLVKVRYTD